MIESQMTSLEIAELVNKKHFHVMRDIREKLIPAIKDESKIGCMSKYSVISTTYEDSYKREKSMYVLGVNAARAFCANYKITEALKLVNRIDELEEELRRKEEELSVMKNIVWEVINGQNYIGQEQALKMAGIKHPRLFMKYLKEDKKFYETVVYKRKLLKSIQCNAEGDKYLKFTKAGFKWLLDSKDKANEWVQGIKKAKAAKPA